MPAQRLLSLQMANGFAVDVDTTTPSDVHARIESHVCYYSYGAYVSHCTFTMTFQVPEEVPEPVAGLAPLVILLALLGRKRIVHRGP